MNEQLKAFIQKATQDSTLAMQLRTENNTNLEESIKSIIKLGEEHGFKFTEADVNELYASYSEASEDELKAISGGSYTKTDEGKLCTNCGCWLGGGGSCDDYQKTCACIAAGAGELTEYGKQQALSGAVHYAGSSSAPVAMWCALWGGH